ncbi:MAG: metal-dependent hydrolase [Candidatus Aenigmatarchaeota archaeon]
MLLLGHIGITAFVSSMIYLPAFFAIVGSLLPDIVDKGLFLLGAPCGRFIAHSIFFFPIAGSVTYLITRNKKFAIAISLGSLLHLIQDMNDNVPFLYPLKNYTFFVTCNFEFEFTPFIIVSEILGSLSLLFVYGFNKNFLKLRKLFWREVNGRFKRTCSILQR